MYLFVFKRNGVLVKVIKLGNLAPGKHWILIVPFLHSMSSRIWGRVESPIIKVIPFFHMWVSPSVSSDFFELEYALSLTVRSLFSVNFLAFSISALNWLIVLSISARWILISIGTLLTSTPQTVFSSLTLLMLLSITVILWVRPLGSKGRALTKPKLFQHLIHLESCLFLS